MLRVFKGLSVPDFYGLGVFRVWVFRVLGLRGLEFRVRGFECP